jgi:hypothetical protein
MVSWLGNSEAIAREGCLHVTDEHFDRAKEGESLQNAEQQSPATASNDQQEDGEASKLPQFARSYRNLRQPRRMGRDSNPR